MTVFLGLVVSTILLGTSPPPSPQFVPGEILIKFVHGTDGSAAVTRAIQVNPPDLGALGPVFKRLQGKMGIPVEAKQVTGGNWVVLSVNSDKLLDQLVTQLRARDNVAKVAVSPEKPGLHVGFSLPKPLVVTFVPGSPESEAVAQKLADAGDARFAQLIRELEKDLDLPLTGEVNDEATVVVQIDLKALTPVLAERLKALSDIESAQPNYILTIK